MPVLLIRSRWFAGFSCLLLLLCAGCTGQSGDSPLAEPDPLSAAPPATSDAAYTINYSFDGNVTTVAGSPGVSGSVDGLGTSALLAWPCGLAYDGGNTLYFADHSSHTVKALDIVFGVVTTIFGQPFAPYPPPSSGSLWGPSYCVISSGVPYFSDTLTGRIMDISGMVIAGVYPSYPATYQDGQGSQARFYRPMGLAEAGGYLYVADGHNHCIRRIDLGSPTYDVTTFAGKPQVAGNWDGVGTGAYFHSPAGLATDGTYLYVTNLGNHVIKRVELSTATVTTIAGKANESGHVDGAATNARFNMPQDIALDGAGKLFIADRWNSAIRVLDNGEVSTISGHPDHAEHRDGAASAAYFNSPTGLAVVGNALYVSDSGNRVIRKIQ